MAELTWEDLHSLMSELRGMAQRLLDREGDARSLQPTALVLSALRRQKPKDRRWEEVSWENRAHFFGAMYRAMNHALVDHARKRRAEKRRTGGVVQASELELEDSIAAATQAPDQILALHEALERLALSHPEWVEVFQHRFHAGLTFEQIAKVMGKGEKTIRRWFAQARLVLHDEVLRILNDQTPGATDEVLDR